MATRNPVSPALAVAGLVALLAACGDDPTRPDGFFDSAEAEAVLRSAASLPSVPGIIAGVAADVDPTRRAALQAANELWAAGVAEDGSFGRSERRRAAAIAAPLVAGLNPAPDWDPVEARLAEWLGTADRMLDHLTLPGIEARVRAARVDFDRARAATADDQRAYHLMLVMAELVETTPRYVARALVSDAAAAVRLAEADPAGRVAGRSLERARRLSDWAARAAAEEDHLRAIQRAYYAIQLVEAP